MAKAYKTNELIDLGVKANVVEKLGAWFSYDSQRIAKAVRTPATQEIPISQTRSKPPYIRMLA
jgi:hypothetical protein